MSNNNVKQVIVFRKDLLKGEKSIRKGKFAAQCAHASVSAILSLFKKEDLYSSTNEKPIGTSFSLNAFEDSPFYNWINGNYAKITLPSRQIPEVELLD